MEKLIGIREQDCCCLESSGTFWRILLLCSLVVLGLCIFPFPNGADDFFWKYVADAFHFPMFFFVSALVFFRWPNKNGSLFLVVGCSLFLIMIGAAIEVVQPYFGRDESFGDAINDALGVLAALVVYLSWGRRWMTVIIAFVLSGVVQLALLVPAWPGLRTIIWRNSNFPQLARFEDPRELLLWSPLNNDLDARATLLVSSERVLEGKHALKVSTVPGDYCGVEYTAGDRSWEGYRAVEFAVYNPESVPFALSLRIDDAKVSYNFNDRFNKYIELNPGWNLVQIALKDIALQTLSHAFDFSRVGRILFFVDEKSKSRVYYIDDLKLLP